jgi:CHAD domain-containing protein
VLAELSRDEVTARRLLSDDQTDGTAESEWHELELELVDGNKDVLEHVTGVLTRHGNVESDSQSMLRRALGDQAPSPPLTPSADSTAGETVRSYLDEQWGRLLREDVRLRAQQADAVHKMRAASRRLRSASAAYRRLFDGDRARHLDDRLRWLARSLSRARDLQVSGGLLRESFAADHAAVASASTAAFTLDFLAAQRREAAAEVAALIDSDEYLQVLDEVAAFVAEPMLSERAARPVSDELRRHVRRTHRRLVRRLAAARAASREQRSEAMHSARKAAERVRYACEAAEPALGKRARRLRQRAESLSEVLGERQEAVVTQQTVVELVGLTSKDSAGRKVAFALGRLHARLEDVLIQQLDSEVNRAADRVQTRKVTSWL